MEKKKTCAGVEKKLWNSFLRKIYMSTILGSILNYFGYLKQVAITNNVWTFSQISFISSSSSQNYHIIFLKSYLILLLWSIFFGMRFRYCSSSSSHLYHHYVMIDINNIHEKKSTTTGSPYHCSSSIVFEPRYNREPSLNTPFHQINH